MLSGRNDEGNELNKLLNSFILVAENEHQF